ncbi:unnamed protein product [Didymodactylos carnosus]|uniref:Uncharacterized protein n=1 Tax=Didymodactylos carnosus TaxID=1234261 RepID=A0A8S2T6P4_9BILA|nr:unnamed protein product [Didymodactylos carnosus]CAF4272818.1 unnamed protein product [Didymodactylos carnosus]
MTYLVNRPSTWALNAAVRPVVPGWISVGDVGLTRGDVVEDDRVGGDHSASNNGSVEVASGRGECEYLINLPKRSSFAVYIDV